LQIHVKLSNYIDLDRYPIFNTTYDNAYFCVGGGNPSMVRNPAFYPGHVVCAIASGRTIGKHRGYGCLFSPTSSSYLTFPQYSSEIVVEVFELPSGKSVLKVKGDLGVFFPDGKRILVSDADTSLVYDLQTSKPVHVLPGTLRYHYSFLTNTLGPRRVLTSSKNAVARVNSIEDDYQDPTETGSPEEVWANWQTKFGLTLSANDDPIPLWPSGPRALDGWAGECRRYGIEEKPGAGSRGSR
jgi:hypothetical protein